MIRQKVYAQSILVAFANKLFCKNEYDQAMDVIIKVTTIPHKLQSDLQKLTFVDLQFSTRFVVF